MSIVNAVIISAMSDAMPNFADSFANVSADNVAHVVPDPNPNAITDTSDAVADGKSNSSANMASVQAWRTQL